MKLNDADMIGASDGFRVIMVWDGAIFRTKPLMYVNESPAPRQIFNLELIPPEMLSANGLAEKKWKRRRNLFVMDQQPE